MLGKRGKSGGLSQEIESVLRKRGQQEAAGAKESQKSSDACPVRINGSQINLKSTASQSLGGPRIFTAILGPQRTMHITSDELHGALAELAEKIKRDRSGTSGAIDV